MKLIKNIGLTLLLIIQVINAFCQQNSTTDIYTKTIDSVIEKIQLGNYDEPVLIMAPQFFKKNIKTYKGKNN